MEAWVEVGNFTMKTGVCMQNCYIGGLTVKEKKIKLNLSILSFRK